MAVASAGDFERHGELAGRVLDRHLLDRPSGTVAITCVTEPGNIHAVATETAPSTPIAA
jgi:hypothetical protein